jgi:type I restriction enzyme S subunit
VANDPEAAVPFDLEPDHEALVRRILRDHIPEREVWVIGSRAAGTAKRYSDLDLIVLGDDPLPREVRGNLEEAFEESDLPFRVDLVEWAATSGSFRRIIQASHRPLQSTVGCAARGGGARPA